MTAGPTAIDIRPLTKRFDDTVAVDRVSFGIRRGEIFGFLGPNGAGKTTIVWMRERSRVMGYDIAATLLGKQT